MMSAAENIGTAGPIERMLLQRIDEEGLRGKKNARLMVAREVLGGFFEEDPSKYPQRARLFETPDGAAAGELAGVKLIVDYRPMEDKAPAVVTGSADTARIDALEANVAATNEKLDQLIALMTKSAS